MFDTFQRALKCKLFIMSSLESFLWRKACMQAGKENFYFHTYCIHIHIHIYMIAYHLNYECTYTLMWKYFVRSLL